MMSEEKLIDLEELEAITGGDQELKQEIFILFLYTIANDVATLKRSIKRELRTEAEARAHSMRGVAKSLAAKKLEKLAFFIETMSNEGKFTEALDSLLLMEVAVCQTIEAITPQLTANSLKSVNLRDSQCTEHLRTKV